MKQFKNVKRNVEKELERRGIDLILQEVSIYKNNIECVGVRIIKDDEVHPIVYFDEGESIRDYIARIIDVIESPSPSIDLKKILNPEYIKKNAFLSLQKYSNSEDGILVKRFLNLEVVPYIYVRDDSFGENEVVSAKISEQFLVQAGVDSVDFFAWAEKNILKHAYIKSLDEMLFEMCEADDEIGMDVRSPFYVASAGKYGGASVLLCPQLLINFCDKHNVDSCTILPSSREEILLIPDGIYSFNPIELVELVNEANCNVVDPILQLDPVVYRFSRNENLVTIIAKK